MILTTLRLSLPQSVGANPQPGDLSQKGNPG